MIFLERSQKRGTAAEAKAIRVVSLPCSEGRGHMLASLNIHLNYHDFLSFLRTPLQIRVQTCLPYITFIFWPMRPVRSLLSELQGYYRGFTHYAPKWRHWGGRQITTVVRQPMKTRFGWLQSGGPWRGFRAVKSDAIYWESPAIMTSEWEKIAKCFPSCFAVFWLGRSIFQMD